MTSKEALRVFVMETGPLAENAYIVEHEAGRKAFVVDPGEDAERIHGELSGRGLLLERILLTHGHFDHVGGVRLLKERTGAEIVIHAAEAEAMRAANRQAMLFGLRVSDPPPPDRLVADGDEILLCDQAFRVLHTPGHAPGHVAFAAAGMVFVGDLVFAGSVGRTDLPGGSYEELLRSIREKILPLPDDTVLFPGHGPATTVGRERRTNPFLTEGQGP